VCVINKRSVVKVGYLQEECSEGVSNKRSVMRVCY